jgi:outer membrane protein TolC
LNYEGCRQARSIRPSRTLKQAEDVVRLTIGASQDPYFGALDLSLTEQLDPAGELLTIDAATAVQQAPAECPEVLASRYALANDDTSIRVAHNQLKPDLSLNGFCQSNRLGGDQFSLTAGPLISQGASARSLAGRLLSGFPPIEGPYP